MVISLEVNSSLRFPLFASKQSIVPIKYSGTYPLKPCRLGKLHIAGTVFNSQINASRCEIVDLLSLSLFPQNMDAGVQMVMPNFTLHLMLLKIFRRLQAHNALTH